MYGTGIRLMKCSRLRVRDIDFGYGRITVHNVKGSKDRVVPLPEKAALALLTEGCGEVYLPRPR